MFKRMILSLAILIVFMATTTRPVFAAKNANSLQIKGSDTMVNLVQAWAEGFMAKEPSIFLAVTGGGSGTGITALMNGTCDIAASSRRITPKEIELAAKKGFKPEEYRVALDGLAVVVNKGNPISKLTIDELADIFTGRVTNWKELGGEDSKIVILSREVNSGTHVYFKEHVVKKGDPKSKEEFSADALLLPSSQAIADEVLQNPSAIGYYGMGYIGKDHQAVSVAKDKASETVFPTIENVISGQYPISRPLFLYTRGVAEGNAKKFLDFVLSTPGQQLVSTVGFVPVQK